MLKNLQKQYLQKQIERNLKNRDYSKLNDSLVRLGFLVDEDLFNDFEKLFEIAKKIGLKRKDVKIFTFMRVKKKLPSLRQNQINNKHFTWNGKIHNQNAQEFLDSSFDVLIGYYKGKNEYMDLMMSFSKAKFKVCFNGTDERLSDLLINVDPLKINKFSQELIKYLKVLNKI